MGSGGPALHDVGRTRRCTGAACVRRATWNARGGHPAAGTRRGLYAGLVAGWRLDCVCCPRGRCDRSVCVPLENATASTAHLRSSNRSTAGMVPGQPASGVRDGSLFKRCNFAAVRTPSARALRRGLPIDTTCAGLRGRQTHRSALESGWGFTLLRFCSVRHQ